MSEDNLNDHDRANRTEPFGEATATLYVHGRACASFTRFREARVGRLGG